MLSSYSRPCSCKKHPNGPLSQSHPTRFRPAKKIIKSNNIEKRGGEAGEQWPPRKLPKNSPVSQLLLYQMMSSTSLMTQGVTPLTVASACVGSRVFVVVLRSTLELALGAGEELSSVRAIRVLRPLRAINRVPSESCLLSAYTWQDIRVFEFPNPNPNPNPRVSSHLNPRILKGLKEKFIRHSCWSNIGNIVQYWPDIGIK